MEMEMVPAMGTETPVMETGMAARLDLRDAPAPVAGLAMAY